MEKIDAGAGYEYSPPVAAVIADDEALRFVIRLLLTPLVYTIANPGEALALLLVSLTIRTGTRSRPGA